jgi:hypothetical protein
MKRVGEVKMGGRRNTGFVRKYGVCDCYYMLMSGMMPGIYSGVNTKGGYNQVGTNGTNTI